MEGGGSEKGEMPTEEAVSEFCFFFGETALELVNKGERKVVETIIGLISNASFDAGKLPRHVKRV